MFAMFDAFATKFSNCLFSTADTDDTETYNNTGITTRPTGIMMIDNALDVFPEQVISEFNCEVANVTADDSKTYSVRIPDRPIGIKMIDNMLDLFPDQVGSEFRCKVPNDMADSKAIEMYIAAVGYASTMDLSKVFAIHSDCGGSITRVVKKWSDVDKYLGGNVPQYPFDDWMLTLFSLNKRLGQMALNDFVAKRNIFVNKELPSGMYHALVPIDPKLFNAEEHRIHDSDIDMDVGGFLLPPSDVVSYTEPDLHALHDTCRTLPSKLPWLSASGTEGEGIVAAGGRLVSAVYKRQVPNQDTDLFVVAKSSDAAIRIIEKTLIALDETYPRDKFVMSVYSQKLTTDVYIFDRVIVTDEDGSESYRPSAEYIAEYQIVHNVYPTASHVIHGFDIDICGLLYDGRDAYATANAARALVNGFNLYDQNKLSKSAEHRYAKYMYTYGFRTLIVGVSQDAITSKFREVVTKVIALDAEYVSVQETLSQLELYITDHFRDAEHTRLYEEQREDVVILRVFRDNCRKEIREICKIVHSPMGLLRRVASKFFMNSMEPEHVSDYSGTTDVRTRRFVRNDDDDDEPSVHNWIVTPQEISCACAGKQVFTGAFNAVVASLVSIACIAEFD